GVSGGGRLPPWLEEAAVAAAAMGKKTGPKTGTSRGEKVAKKRREELRNPPGRKIDDRSDETEPETASAIPGTVKDDLAGQLATIRKMLEDGRRRYEEANVEGNAVAAGVAQKN